MVEVNKIYHLDWSDEAAILEWNHNRVVPDPYIQCPENPAHGSNSRKRTNSLHLAHYNGQLTDFSWTYYSECLVTEHAGEILVNSGLSGFSLQPAFIDRRSSDRVFELKITGWGGVAPPQSGIKLLYECPKCGFVRYSSFDDPSRIFDPQTWDGSDFFFIWPLPRYVMVTQRVISVINTHNLKGIVARPLYELKWSGEGYGPFPLWHYVGRERAEVLLGRRQK